MDQYGYTDIDSKLEMLTNEIKIGSELQSINEDAENDPEDIRKYLDNRDNVLQDPDQIFDLETINDEMIDLEMGFTNFDILILTFTTFLNLVNVVYFAHIQNLIFTNNNIPTSIVPCYDEDLYEGLGSSWMDQYLFLWFLNEPTWLLFILPFVQIFFWVVTKYKYSKSAIANSIFLGVTLAIIVFPVFFWQVNEAIFCNYYNDCRSCSCVPKVGNCSANENFIFRIVYVAFYIIVIFVFGCFSTGDEFEDNGEETARELKRSLINSYLRKL